MDAMAISRTQRELSRATHNLDAFTREWVVLRGDLVTAHSHTVEGLMEQDAIQGHDALFFVPKEDAPLFSC